MTWEVKEFEDCLDKVNYTNKIQRKDFLESGKFPIVSQEQEYINGYWNNSQDVFKIIKPVIIFGDHTQVLKYVDFDFVLGADGVKILQPINKIDSKFFYYYMLSVNLKSLGYARHYRLLKEKTVPIPPPLEQKRIVAILDKAFENISKAKENAGKNLNNANEIFESYLQSIFENKGEGWEECNLEEYIKLIDYRGRTPVKTESGVRLITAKNVKLGYLELEPQEFIHQNNYNSWMTRGIPDFGDVIFTTEAPLANVAQINTKEKLAFAQRIIVMQPQKDKIDQTFLKYMLISKPIRNQILEKGTGATVQGIKSRLLKKIRIYFPKKVIDQQVIVKKLNTTSKETKQLEAIYEKKLTNLEELKKSILQKAFNGELIEVSA